jgi:hypothetical protein
MNKIVLIVISMVLVTLAVWSQSSPKVSAVRSPTVEFDVGTEKFLMIRYTSDDGFSGQRSPILVVKRQNFNEVEFSFGSGGYSLTFSETNSVVIPERMIVLWSHILRKPIIIGSANAGASFADPAATARLKSWVSSEIEELNNRMHYRSSIPGNKPEKVK